MNLKIRVPLTLILGTILISCQEETISEPYSEHSSKINDMIQQFHNEIHHRNRSGISGFNILNVTTDTYEVTGDQNFRSNEESTAFDIHTVSIDFDGTPGYAILSDTPGIEKIFYYTEEGCIGDTATIFPLKDMVESFPKIAEDILTGNITETRADFPNYPNIDNIVRFQWHQTKPFNNYSADCTCSICSQPDRGKHRPIGCVAIAMGQAIATVQKFTGTFFGNRDIDFDNLPKNDSEGNATQYLQIAHFLQEIALNCQTKFGCEGSSTRLEAAYNYLKDLGYSPTLTDGALIDLKYIQNLSDGYPHIIAGHKGTKGHCWILDGYRNNASGRHYHINWGWGTERSNGWSIGIYFGYHSTSGGEEYIEYKEKLQQLYLN